MSNTTEPAVLVTNDAVTLILEGEVFTGSRDYAEKSGVLVALKQKAFRKAADLLNKAKAITRRSLGAFVVENGVILNDGVPVHNVMAERIIQLSDAGLPFMAAVNALKNLLENPSKRAVDELYLFLEHRNMPLTEDGHFLAYKSVQSDYLSKATGREPVEVSTDGGKTWKTYVGKIPNNVGNLVRMKRNLVDDNRQHECSFGLHVGALGYSGPNGWYHQEGDKIVIVKVNPRDAVSVPSDANAQKLRVSQYEVIADFKGAYEAPLASSEGEEYPHQSDNPEVFCSFEWDGCGWEGSYSELKGGYACPDCLSTDTLDAFE